RCVAALLGPDTIEGISRCPPERAQSFFELVSPLDRPRAPRVPESFGFLSRGVDRDSRVGRDDRVSFLALPQRCRVAATSAEIFPAFLLPLIQLSDTDVVSTLRALGSVADPAC